MALKQLRRILEIEQKQNIRLVVFVGDPDFVVTIFVGLNVRDKIFETVFPGGWVSLGVVNVKLVQIPEELPHINDGKYKKDRPFKLKRTVLYRIYPGGNNYCHRNHHDLGAKGTRNLEG